MDVLTSDQAQVGEELERNAERSALLAAVQALNPRERQSWSCASVYVMG